MIDEFDQNSTEISTTASYVVNPEDICQCDRYYLQGYDCGCPQDPRVRWYGVNLRITQRPIKTEPINSVYSVRIFETNTYESEVNNRDLFCSENIIAEFSVADSISFDTNKTYIEYIKSYIVTGKDHMLANIKERNYSFQGRKSKDIYLKTFRRIVQTMVNNFDAKKEDPKDIENAHIGRRKKMK